MSAPPPGTFSINLSGTLGVLLATTFIAIAFWGGNIVQAFVFYSSSRDNPIVTKALVAWLLSLETIRLGLITRGICQPLIIEWGNTDHLLLQIKEFDWQVLPFVLVTVPSQAFFLYRIYLLANRPLWILVPAIAALLTQLVVCSLFIVFTIHIPLTLQFRDDPRGVIMIWVNVGLSLLVDVFIATYLTIYVVRNKTGIRQTASMANRLIIFSVATGLWTALLALAILITSVAAPSSTVILGLQFIDSGFYTTSVLANLNARDWVRGGSEITGALCSLAFPSTVIRSEDRAHPLEFPKRSDTLGLSSFRLSRQSVPTDSKTDPILGNTVLDP